MIPDQDDPAETAEPEVRPLATTGVALMVLSLALWILLPAVPFLPMGAGGKVALSGAVVIIAEVVFWLGAVLAGPAAVRRVRSWWRSRESRDSG